MVYNAPITTIHLNLSTTQNELLTEEGLDIIEEFYSDESRPEQYQQAHDLNHVQDIQKGLQQSVQALNYNISIGN